MRYLGGKSRIAKQLAAEIDKVRKPGQWVWEPFCGGLSMTVALSKNGPVWATDANAALIALYQAMRDGWDPPTEVSRETWEAAKRLPDSDPMKAFCGFGCSYGGAWFSAYAAPQKANPAHGPNWERLTFRFEAQSARNLKRSVPCVKALNVCDFLTVTPRPTECAVYCDPPYRGTAGYAAIGAFDSDAFVCAVIGWSRFTEVWVSEYAFPVGLEVWNLPMKRSSMHVRSAKTPPIERLYYIAKGSMP